VSDSAGAGGRLDPSGGRRWLGWRASEQHQVGAAGGSGWAPKRGERQPQWAGRSEGRLGVGARLGSERVRAGEWRRTGAQEVDTARHRNRRTRAQQAGDVRV
jgi:hypothetical protein